MLEDRFAILPDDTARARRNDPLTSHRAADKSARTKQRVADAVIILVRQQQSLTGSALNDLYRRRMRRYRWPLVHFDSPRKRAGELVREGLLIILNEDDKRGTEHEYALSAFAQEVAA
jgi:hypothetical protein